MPHIKTFGILILAVCLTQFASDIYAPSLPFIIRDLNTTSQQAQWTMVIYMISIAFSQLVYGPLSEQFGRKPIIIFGLTVMLIGSLVCFWAHSIQILLIGRSIQGVGAGACAALWRSIFRDCFKGEDLSRFGSYLMILVMFIVPAAPVLGGYLQNHMGWTASFGFMSLYALISLLLFSLFFKETLPIKQRKSLNYTFIKSTYLMLLSDPSFLCASVCMFLSYGAFFSWFTVGPILLIEKAGISPIHFGWFTFLGCGAAYGIAGWLNGKLVKKLGIYHMLAMGWSLMILASLGLYASYGIYGLNAIAIGVPIILFYFGSTFIWPNTYAMAFNPWGSVAGFVGALYGFMQLAGGGCIAYLTSFLSSHDQRPLALTLGLTSSAALLMLYLYVNWGHTKREVETKRLL